MWSCRCTSGRYLAQWTQSGDSPSAMGWSSPSSLAPRWSCRSCSSSTEWFINPCTGEGISLRGIMLFTWGADNRRYTAGIRQTVDLPGLAPIVADQFFIVLAALLLAVLTYFQLYHTRLGTAMRATADNPALARASGIDVAATRRWTWIIGGALTAVAGCLLALQSQLSPDLGFVLLLPIFAAAILGGVGSPHGAFIGGLIVGVVGEVAVGVGIISPGYKLAVVFVVLVAVILLRPQGLFGARE